MRATLGVRIRAPKPAQGGTSASPSEWTRIHLREDLAQRSRPRRAVLGVRAEPIEDAVDHLAVRVHRDADQVELLFGHGLDGGPVGFVM
jgi:hypothetical protein